MKVLYITNLPSPYRVEFFSELGKKCDLTVVYERKTAADRDKKWNAKSQNTYREVFLSGKAIGNENSFCPEIIKHLKKDYDHIIIGVYSTYTAMFAALYMRMRGIPYIISSDGGFVAVENKLKYYIKRFFIGSAKAWLSTGKETTKYLQYYGADLKNIYEYPFTSLCESDILSVPTPKEEKDMLRQQLGLKGEKIIVSVGQFIYRKGFDVLIEAINHLGNDIQLYIIGGEKENLQKLIGGELPPNVNTLGFMDKKTLFKYYRAADLFVLPTREDIWGLVINEAMACGLPVITTDKCIAGLELIENGVNGYIVSVGNSKELAQRIDDVFYCNENDIGQSGLHIISKYTFKFMVQYHIDILMDIKGHS